MDLFVALEQPGAASSCFVTLPPAIVSTLLQEENLQFLVLAVKPKSRGSVETPTKFVAWDGGASLGHGQIGLHASFANALGLEEGQSVSVEAIERGEADRIPNSAACICVETAAEYALVSTTAEFVEGALLQQIRVLYTGLVFPLRLPGRQVLHLKVSSLRAQGESPEFLVLHSGVEITVLAPGEDESASSDSVDAAEEFEWKRTFRALPSPGELLSQYPVHVLACGRHNSATSTKPLVTYRTSIRRSLPTSPRVGPLPVALCVSNDFQVPDGHVYVPVHIWWHLGLAPLTPITLSLLPDDLCLSGPSALRVVPSNGVQGPAVELQPEFRRFPVLVFPGMLVGGGDWIVSGPGDSNDYSLATKLHERRLVGDLVIPELCDSRWHDRGEDEFQPEDEIHGEPESSFAKSVSQGNDSALSHAPGDLSHGPVWILSGHESFISVPQRLQTGGNLDQPQIKTSANYLWQSWPPDGSQTVKRDSLRELRGATAREVVDNVACHLAAAGIEDDSACKPHSPRFALLRGEEGCGKTSLGKGIAKLMRLHYRYRTMWVRWRAHKGEPTAVSVARVQAVFAAARESQPCLIVFDDLDVVCASQDQTRNENRDVSAEEIRQGESNSHAIAQAVVEGLKGCESRSENQVDVLATGGKDGHLDEELLVPGVVSLVVTVKELSAEDRACVLSCLVESQSGSGVLQGGSNALRKSLCRVAEECNGFTPRDLANVVERSVMFSRKRGVPSCAITSAGLEEAARSVVPRSRLGIRFEGDSTAGNHSSWDLVGGLKEAKVALRELLELPAMYPTLFSDAPVRLQTGVLLYGPPGTGKTLLATVAAQACRLRSILVRGPELLSKYIGESEAEVRRLFQRASTLSPCVIIFDEFDSLAPRRGGETTGVADRVVNTLLTSLDGVEGLAQGVYVIATSSHPELIDPAVLRPGRIDKWIPVDFPESDERLEIIQTLWSDMNIGTSATSTDGTGRLVRATAGWSGADIRGLLTDVHLVNNGEPIELTTILNATKKCLPSVSELERRRYKLVMDFFGRRESRDHHPGKHGKQSVRVALQ